MEDVNQVAPDCVQPQMCATCPFRDGSSFEMYRQQIELRVLTQSNHLCHAPQLHGKKADKVCRGAREYQKLMFWGIGLLPDTSDHAYNALLEVADLRTNLET